MSDVTYIYGLFDPRDDSCCYVGKSNHPKKRLGQHIREAQAEQNGNLKGQWIRELLAEGLEPELQILTDAPQEDWQEAEKELIAHFRQAGEFLLNVVSGGNGGSLDSEDLLRRAWEENPERKALLAQRNEEMWTDPEFRELFRSKMEEYWSDPEFRERASEAQKKAWTESSEERRKAVSERNNANWADPEYRRHMVEINKEIWSDPDRLQEHAERTKAMWQDPEYREKVIAASTTPEVLKRKRAASVAYWADEEKRRARSEKYKARWADPDFRRDQLEKRARTRAEKLAAQQQEAAPEQPEQLKLAI